MKHSLILLAFSAVVVNTASTPVNHAGATFNYKGSGQHSMAIKSDYQQLGQYYDYENTNGTVMNTTSRELINGDDDNQGDRIKLSWMWYLRAGWSGTYKSGYESY